MDPSTTATPRLADPADVGTRTGRPTRLLATAFRLPLVAASAARRHVATLAVTVAVTVVVVLVVVAWRVPAVGRLALVVQFNIKVGLRVAALFMVGAGVAVAVVTGVVLVAIRLGVLLRRVVGGFAQVPGRALYATRVAAMRARASVAVDPAPPTRPDSWEEWGPPSAVFSASVAHNRYLSPGSRRVEAIIEVAATIEEGDHPTERAEVVLLDCSGSMGRPWSKLRAARRATIAVLDVLPDGAWFAVVRGDHGAGMVYPPGEHLVRADDITRAAATRAVRRIWPEGGTAMGHWLIRARDLLATRPGAIAHALLVTDGRDESEAADALDVAIEGCVGAFQCDCRGVGVDWELSELGAIAGALGGTVDIVANPVALRAELAAATAAATARHVDQVSLDVQVPSGATVQSLRQLAPTVQDLTARMVVDGPRASVALSAWGSESRLFHLVVDVPGHDVGTDLLAARVRVMWREQVVAHAAVTATWTDDVARTDAVDPAIAHYAAQVAIVDHVRDGLAARGAGADDDAAAALGRAARLAEASGHDEARQLLARVVEIDETGAARLRSDASRADELALATRSTRTVRLPGPGPRS